MDAAPENLPGFCSRAYWLEGYEWEGDHWGEPGREIVRDKGESFAEAEGRIVLPLLGELGGKVSGQTVRIAARRHVADLTVWLGDGMIDWSQRINLKIDGRQVFTGKVMRDLGVCLAEASRTFDFDRLRWAGIRVDNYGATTPVTPSTKFPPLIRVP